MNHYLKIAAGFLTLLTAASETPIQIQEDFKVEKLYSPSEAGLGSWVSMTFDPQGRLITSDQFGGLYRLRLESPIQVEKLSIPGDTLGFGAAQGMVFHKDVLYLLVNYNGKDQHKSGLYKLEDLNKDDTFETLTLIKGLKGEGEHGPHSLVLDPAEEHLYLIAGNHTDLPKMDEYLLSPTWKHDNLYPFLKDPRGHATDRKEPGGWIAKVELASGKWTLVAAGFRNAFDLAFNEDGELFAYDSDMEWDLGMPWYRSTRLCHVINGSEFGWRTGSGKWPEYHVDQVAPLLHMGQGSPTNLISLKNAAFPEDYKNTLLAFDWSFGIIYSIHLKRERESYQAEKKEFLSGIPLPLTDGVIGPDGALYFLTGGRKLQSNLYKVSYVGNKPRIKPSETLHPFALRRKLESLPKDLDQIWPYLDHEEAQIKYAARMALEHISPEKWKTKVLSEPSFSKRIIGLMALCRAKEKVNKAGLERSLLEIPVNTLTLQQRLEYWRVWEIYISRHGQPIQITAFHQFLPFPNQDDSENRQVAKLMVATQHPKAVSRLLPYLEQNQENVQYASAEHLILRNPNYGIDLARLLEKLPPENQMFYAILLSEQKVGWTPKLEETYFKWYKKAFQYRGGLSYVGFLDNARKNALNRVTRKTFLHQLSGGDDLNPSGNDLITAPEGPGRSWKTEDATALFKDGWGIRDFSKGQNLYKATLCDKCHTLQGEGGNIGPDLTRLGTRFDIKGIVEAIIEPNLSISDQYAATHLQLKNGETRVGKIINEDAQYISLSQNPFTPTITMKIPKKDVVSRQISTVSMMLPGLINGLNEEEVRDLVAFLMAGGDPNHSVYQP